ncbi:unnamed protein product [Lathyrus sativus]|nr:unnamed protein product [Lathyrus sativus]
MDFFSMKRKKLQSLCKKHGIPANLKNKDMAEKLSLIYKEEKNENPGSRRLRSDVDKSNVEIIVLDSDSDSEVQMEALDTVAEKDSNEKTNVSTEHLVDAEPDQSLTTSPRSEVKSDHNIIPPLDDSDTVAEKDSNEKTNVSTEHLVDAEPDQSLTTSPRSEVKSDHNIIPPLDDSDTVAEKDSNEKTNVSTEHLLDEEPNQSLTTSPRSEVKSDHNIIPHTDDSATPSDLNIHHMVDSEEIEQVHQLDDNIYVMDEAAAMCLDASTAVKHTDEVKSYDLNNIVSHPLRSDEDKLNLEIPELDSDNDIDVQMEASEKDCNERTNVSAEHLLDEEPNQFITTSPPSEVKSSDTNNLLSRPLRTDEDKLNLEITELDSDVQMEASDTVAEKDCNEKTNMSAEHLLHEEPDQLITTSPLKLDSNCDTDIQMEASDDVAEKNSNEKTNVREGHLLDKELDQFLTTSPLSEVKSSDLNVQNTVDSGIAAANADACEVKPATPREHNVHDMIDSGTAVGNEDACEVKLTSERSGNVGSFYVEEDINMRANVLEAFGNYTMLEDQTSSESTYVHEDTDYHCVISQAAKTCHDASPGVKNTEDNTNVSVENILDEVHLSSLENSNGTPAQFLKTNPLSEVETSDLDADKMVARGTDTKSAYTSGAKFESSLNMSTSPASKEMVGSSTKLLPRDTVFCNMEVSMQIGANKEQVDPSQEKMMEFSPKLFNNPGSPTNGDIGFCGLEENLEIGVNKENIDANEDAMHAEPSAMVLSDNENLIQAVSEEPGNNLMEDEVANVDNKFDIVEDVPGSVNPGSKKNADLNTYVSGGDILDEVHSSSFEDSDVTPVQFLTTDPLKEAETSDLDVPGNNLMEDEVANVDNKFDIVEDVPGSVNPGSKKNADLNTYVSGGDILDEVHSSSFEDSDVTPVQFLTTDPLKEAETSDLDVHTMFETATATNADTSGAKFRSSQKISLSPTSKEIVGSSTKLLNNSVAPRDVVFCNAEKSMQIGANKEQVDPSQEKMMRFSPTLFNSPETPTNGGIGLCGLEENMEIDVNKENIDSNEDVMHEEPSMLVMSDNEDLIQAVSEELGNDLMEGEVANMDDKFDLLEDVHGSVNPGGTNSTHASNIKADLNTYVTGGDILDEVHASSFEDSDGTPVKFSDLDLHKMFETATATKNQDISGLKIESLPKMSLYPTPEKMIGSSRFEDSNGTPVQFLPTDPLREAETSDLYLHKMFETASATKNADTSGVKFESSRKMSLTLTPEKMIDSSPKLLNNSGTPTNFGFCDVDENLQVGANKENIDHSDKVLHAEPSLVVRRDDEEVDLSISQMAAQETCEEEMLKSSEKTCMVADPEECIGFSLNDLEASAAKGSEAETYFKSTALGDVMETCNMEGSMQTNMMEGENSQEEKQGYSASWKKKGSDVDDNSGAISDKEVKADELVPAVPQSWEMESCDFGLQQLFAQDIAFGDEESSMMHKNMEISMIEEENNREDCVSAQRVVSKLFDNSDVHDDIGRVGGEEENQAHSASRKRKCDVDETSGANSDSVMESSDFGLQQVFAQDTASGDEESSKMHTEMEILVMLEDCIQGASKNHPMIEEENNQEDCISVQQEEEIQAYSANLKRKRSHVDDTSSANSIEKVKADELVLAVPQPSEMDSCNFSLQQLFAQDTASGDQDVCLKKLDSPSKATPIASGEKNIIFTPKFNESSMMNKEMEIAMIEEENNQEDCIAAQREVCKFLDNSDVHDGIGLDGAKDDQVYWASRKRKMSDMDDTSGGNSDEEVKADELVPAVPQYSEMESSDFGLPQLFAQDTASGDEDAYQKKLDSSSKGTPTASGEKSIIFTPKLQESSMMRKKMKIEMNLSQKPATRDSVGACDMKENIKTDKNEDISSTVLRNKFAKRLPLQDLHQN